MKIPSLVKLPKYRRFKYKPRHYDPVMDDLDARVQRIKREMGEDVDTSKTARIMNFRNSGLKKADIQTLVIRLVLIGIFILDTVGYFYVGWGKIFQLAMLGEILAFYLWYRFLRGRSIN